MPDVSRLNLNIPVPNYPPPPRPDRADSVVQPATLNVPSPPTLGNKTEPFIVPGRTSVNPPLPPPPVNAYGGPHYSHGIGPPTPGPPGPPGLPGPPGGPPDGNPGDGDDGDEAESQAASNYPVDGGPNLTTPIQPARRTCSNGPRRQT